MSMSNHELLETIVTHLTILGEPVTVQAIQDVIVSHEGSERLETITSQEIEAFTQLVEESKVVVKALQEKTQKAHRHSYDGQHFFYEHQDCAEKHPIDDPFVLEDDVALADVPENAECCYCLLPMYGRSMYEQGLDKAQSQEPQEDTETRAIKALVEDIQSNLLESIDATSVDDFGRAGGHDKQANKIESALVALYNITIEEEESDIIHVLGDFRTPWKDFDLANWQWIELEKKESNES